MCIVLGLSLGSRRSVHHPEERGFRQERQYQMRMGNQRRSDNFEDRGRGSGGGQIGGQLLFKVVRLLGFKGAMVVGVLGAGIYLVAPQGMKSAMANALVGSGGVGTAQGVGPSACTVSESNAAACDFSRAVLASTEDVWSAIFAQGALPGAGPSKYQMPDLVVFSDRVTTGGCGSATSAAGPFYCPADGKFYLDPTF